MVESRRRIIRDVVSFTGLAVTAGPLLLAIENQVPYKPSPNAPNPAYPQGMNGPGPSGPDQKTIDKQNQVQIRSDVDKLYALVGELKQEVSLTNSSNVLSLSVVKKAKEIEKIAKQVSNLARG